MVTAPYFLATKLEAFRGRGGFLGSPDIADFVRLVDGHEKLAGEIAAEEPPVRAVIAGSFCTYRGPEAFAKAVVGHRLPDAVSQPRVPLVLDWIDQRADVMDQRADVMDQRADVMDQRADVMDQRADVMDQRADVMDQRADVMDQMADADQAAAASWPN